VAEPVEATEAGNSIKNTDNLWKCHFFWTISTSYRQFLADFLWKCEIVGGFDRLSHRRAQPQKSG
jgi:hypothetical protein